MELLLALVQEVKQNQETKSWHFKKGNRMGDAIARTLREEFDRTISLLLAGMNGGA
jgi:hypothetical protein